MEYGHTPRFCPLHSWYPTRTGAADGRVSQTAWSSVFVGSQNHLFEQIPYSIGIIYFLLLQEMNVYVKFCNLVKLKKMLKM